MRPGYWRQSIREDAPDWRKHQSPGRKHDPPEYQSLDMIDAKIDQRAGMKGGALHEGQGTTNRLCRPRA